METTAYSLLIGIFSSIFATAILVTASEVTRRVLLPWYADKIYRGARIDGRWNLTSFEGNNTEQAPAAMYLQLKQIGDKVTGVYSHRIKNDVNTSYILSGQIRDRYFTATAIPESNQHIDTLAFLFYIESKGKTLVLSGMNLQPSSPFAVGVAGPLVFSLQST